MDLIAQGEPSDRGDPRVPRGELLSIEAQLFVSEIAGMGENVRGAVAMDPLDQR